MEELVPKAAIIEAATDAGYGEDRHLARTFVEWQQIGLLGKMVRKAPRRGGEGLWHPVQQELFLDLLRRRGEGLHVTTLANVPVAAWRLGVAGIETGQVQLALSFWTGYLILPDRARAPDGGRTSRHRRADAQWGTQRPHGDRSLLRRAAEARVEMLASPGASTNAKRELRQLVEIVNAGNTVSPDTMARALLGVMPTRGSPTKRQREAVRHLSVTLSVQLLAARNIEHLSGPTATPLWEWAREITWMTWPDYMAGRPEYARDPEVGHLHHLAPEDDLFGHACAGVLFQLGLGLACNGSLYGLSTPQGWPPPPASSDCYDQG